MASEYRLKRRVHFYETDAAGIVHFSCYYRYMEEAEHALWRAAGMSIEPPDAALGWPRVATSFEYHSPLRFEDEFEICIRIVAMTEKSIRYSCALTRGDVRIATGAMTIVCVNKLVTPMKVVPIPAEVTRRLQVADASESPRSG